MCFIVFIVEYVVFERIFGLFLFVFVVGFVFIVFVVAFGVGVRFGILRFEIKLVK